MFGSLKKLFKKIRYIYKNVIFNIGILWRLITNDHSVYDRINDIRSSHIGVIYEFRWTIFPVRRQPAANNDVDFDRETDKTKTDLDTESCVAAIDRTGSLRIRAGHVRRASARHTSRFADERIVRVCIMHASSVRR